MARSSWGEKREKQVKTVPGRFVTFLKDHSHFMKIADLTFGDGQAFVVAINHTYFGSQISSLTKKRY